jgi:hypothetical protein
MNDGNDELRKLLRHFLENKNSAKCSTGMMQSKTIHQVEEEGSMISIEIV